jgi:hypothetical protein
VGDIVPSKVTAPTGNKYASGKMVPPDVKLRLKDPNQDPRSRVKTSQNINVGLQTLIFA